MRAHVHIRAETFIFLEIRYMFQLVGGGKFF